MSHPVDASSLRKELSRTWFKLAAVSTALTAIASIAYVVKSALPAEMDLLFFIHMAAAAIPAGVTALAWLYENHVLSGASLALLMMSKFYAARACVTLLPLGSAFEKPQESTARDGIALDKKAQRMINCFFFSIIVYVVGGMLHTLVYHLSEAYWVFTLSFAFLAIFAALASTPLVKPAYLKEKSDENREFWSQIRHTYWTIHGSGAGDWISDTDLSNCLAAMAKNRLKELHE